jgi:hypothetical protein
MTVTDRFSNLTKVPDEPAAKLLAQHNLTLDTVLTSPASASIETVLKELAAAEDGGLDILQLLAAALPVRERVWWACLAARDIVGEGPENETRCLMHSEAWVFRPTEENREQAIISLEHADMDDVTVHCATGVQYCDDTLGPGDMAQLPAPPGGAAIAAFAMNLESLAFNKDNWDDHLEVLIDRALDIARGGNGKSGQSA